MFFCVMESVFIGSIEYFVPASQERIEGRLTELVFEESSTLSSFDLRDNLITTLNISHSEEHYLGFSTPVPEYIQ